MMRGVCRTFAKLRCNDKKAPPNKHPPAVISDQETSEKKCTEIILTYNGRECMDRAYKLGSAPPANWESDFQHVLEMARSMTRRVALFGCLPQKHSTATKAATSTTRSAQANCTARFRDYANGTV